MTEIPALVSEWKSIVVFPGWSKPEKEDGYMRFSAPLEIGGIVEQGLTFQGGCYRDHPDRHVTFQLCWHTIRGTVPLERLDWKSLQGGHTNRRAGPPDWAGKRVSETHLHAFELNWVVQEQRMRKGNLPLAMEISEELQTFEQLLQYTGNRFRIKNIAIVATPEWEYKLV